MCSGLRLLLALTVVLSVFCIVSSKVKHGHKKSHGPLRPGESKISHGKGKPRGHVAKHDHFKKTIHASHHHLKHRHHLKHGHQQTLHLKAHKKGITFAKAPAEPSACIDFLPCLQYRYYHCRRHEWIRNNCPKLCLYCEHEPFPEPVYGRFKPVAASYPDWCLDHSQCVAYPTEACPQDEWMKLNCLRKCDVCMKYKKVKAGIVFVGPPFDRTDQQRKEEEQLNKILHFRPTLAPAKAKDFHAHADQKKWSHATAPANRPATTVEDKPISQPNIPTNFPPKTLVDSPVKPVEKPISQPNIPTNSPPKTLVDSPVKPVEKPISQPDFPTNVPPKTLVDSPVKPVSAITPNLPIKSNQLVVKQQSLAMGKLETRPDSQPKPVAVNLPTSNQIPKAKNPIGMPAYSYQDLIKQELKAAKESPSTKQFKAEVLKEVQIKLKDGHFPQINTASVFAKHKVTRPRRKHVVAPLRAPKHHVIKHKVTKPRRKHVVESVNAPKHHVAMKPKANHAGNIKKIHNEEKASVKHLLKKEKNGELERAKSHGKKMVKVKKQRDKVARKKGAVGRRMVKKG